jgi:mono/diheme cytochrome c family protein
VPASVDGLRGHRRRIAVQIGAPEEAKRMDLKKAAICLGGVLVVGCSSGAGESSHLRRRSRVRELPPVAGRLPDTAPYGWDGAGNDLSHHLDHTISRLQGMGLEEKERTALLRYISTLPGPPTHQAAPAGTLDRGQTVFLGAGCGSCHAVEGAWTDGRSHDVTSRVAADGLAAFDTPSLRFVGGTAPFFHDGRYGTLRELLTRSDGPMGAARKMPAEDIDALESFVRSL